MKIRLLQYNILRNTNLYLPEFQSVMKLISKINYRNYRIVKRDQDYRIR